ncbi:putative type 2A phosphatase activator [Scheffersomyces coipomensis]|uniref:putative type 2A phosphatase activator n=1 Tax=Scheffersomyces coipomensis TaxID=1788519 RepID=UPI00315DFA74
MSNPENKGKEDGHVGTGTTPDHSKSSKIFARPNQPRLPRAGIEAVHVNQAREMVRLHTSGRLPSGQASGSVPHPHVSSTSSQFTATSNITRTSGIPQHPSLISKTTTTTTRTSSSIMSSSFPSTSSNRHNNHKGASVSVPAIAHDGECNNPSCEHCGGVIIPAPQASFPIEDRPSITINDWSIYTVKKPILNSQELDDLSEHRFDFPLPEMIFGNNFVRIINDKTGEEIEFNALDALDSLDPDCKFKVSYHEEWLASRKSKSSNSSEKSEKALKENSTKDISTFTENLDTLKPYDWTYSPNYKGHVKNLTFHKSTQPIPIQKLLKPDPILFFDESILFEDELADNGISMLSTKIRVMPTCLLLLCRFFLRIDNVIFRIRDTRVFIDFETNQILREYKEQEFPYDELLTIVTSNKNNNDPKKLLRDINWVAQNIPVISTVTESNIKD